MNNRSSERPTPRARHPERVSYRESLVVVGGARPLAHPGRGLGAVVVPTGPTYANSVCDALRRRVVTFDGFCPVKKPRVPEEASGVAVGRGRLSLGPTGPTYANSDCDVLRRRVVTLDGSWPVKRPRVPKEAPLIGGHGLGLSLVTTGPTYVNRVRDAPRRGGVPSDGSRSVKRPRVSKEAPLIGGHGPALSLVTEGTAYVNRVRDVLRRRVVTSDGFWPVKKLRVLEEASWVVVGRGRRSRPGPVQSALEGRIATHGSLWGISCPGRLKIRCIVILLLFRSSGWVS